MSAAVRFEFGHKVFRRFLVGITLGWAALVGPASASLLDESVTRLNLANVNRVTQGIWGFDVTALPNGGFAVVWAESADASKDGSGSTSKSGQVYLQRYDHNGRSLGMPVTVYQALTETPPFSGFPLRPAVAADDQGNLVVAWTVVPEILDLTSQCRKETALMVRRVDSEGVVELGSPDISAGKPCGVDVGMDADGDIALLWAHLDESGLVHHQHIQSYLSDGTVIDSIDPVESKGAASLGMHSDGRFVLAWSELYSGSHGDEGATIKAQLYDLQLNTLGEPYRLDHGVNSGLSVQIKPTLSATQDDGLVAIWSEVDAPYNSPGNSSVTPKLAIRGQRWFADATAGAAMVFAQRDNSSGYALSVSTPSIGMDSHDNVLAAWVVDPPSDGVSLVPSVSEATAFNKERQLLEQRQFDYAGYVWSDGDVGRDDINGGRVVVSDRLSVIAWVQFDRTVSPERMQLNALVLPALQAIDLNPSSNSTGHSTSHKKGGGAWSAWLLLLVGLLATLRNVRFKS